MRLHVEKTDNQEERGNNKGTGGKMNVKRVAQKPEHVNKHQMEGTGAKRDYVKGPSNDDAGNVLGFEVTQKDKVRNKPLARGDGSDDEGQVRRGGRGGRGRGDGQGSGRGRGGHGDRNSKVARLDAEGNPYTDDSRPKRGRDARGGKHEGFDRKDGTGRAGRGGMSRKGDDRADVGDDGADNA